jgi:hypothetical protein
VLVRLARTDWDKVDEGDFSYYFLDLAHSDLQPDLFRHVFPACLQYWYDTLMRDTYAGRFHYALVQGQILEEMLSPRERESLLEFFRDGFLDRIEKERDFARDRGSKANAWIFRFNELCSAVPVIPRIWESWWTLDHPGKAVSAVMYSSGLVYLPGENPIFGAWTEDHGPGGPYLDSTFGRAWGSDNLTFLRTTLSVRYILEKLEQAAAALQDNGDAKMARQVAKDAKIQTNVIEMRITELIDALS